MTAITDSTARIQQELDSGKKVIELKDELYLISATLKIHSGQTLIAGKNTRFLLAPGSSCPLIANDGADDRDICIDGGIWDYDNTKQAPNHWFGTDRLWTAEKYEESVPHGWVMKFRFVKGLTLRNMIIRNPASFSAALSDIDGFLVENIHFEQTTWNPEPLCMDGIHVNGNCHHGIIRNLTGKTYDDMVALNADDSWECSDSRGPITDILIENVTGDASYRFMRLQAIDSTVENIRIRNIRGSFGSTGVLLSLFYTELNKYVSFLFRATMDLQPTEALEDNSSEEELNKMYMNMYTTAISAHGRFMDELYTRTPFIDKRVVKEFFMLAFACYENIEYFLEIKDKLCKRIYKNDKQYQKYADNLEDILQKQQKLNNFLYTYIKWQKSCLRNGTDIRDADIVRFPNIEDYFENLM